MADKRRILVVDDSTESREALAAQLRFIGYDVWETCDGEQALAVAAEYRPHLFLIDVRMPGMSGLELLQRLDTGNGASAAIMMTGHENINDACRAMELGAVSYLRKPVRFEELSQHLERAFDKIREFEQSRQVTVGLAKELSHHSRKVEETFRLAQFQSRRFDLILDNMKEALLAIDADGRAMMVNRAAENAFGIVAGQALGRMLVDVLPPGDIRLCVNRIDAARAAGEEQIPECQFEHGGRYFSVSFSRLALETGESAGWVMIFTDTSSHYEAEQLRRSFLSVVSHEFRTPLSFLQNAVSLLGIKKYCWGEMDLVRKNIEETCTKLTRLVDAVVTFAQISGDDIVPKFGIVDIAELFRSCAARHTANSDARGVVIRTITPMGNCTAVTDGTLLAAAIDQLVDNAIKYSPDNGTIEVRLSFDNDREHPALRISIEDNGPGIPEELRTFPFFFLCQGENPLIRKHQGIGLGLALARRAVMLLGGTITIGTGVRGGCLAEISVPSKPRTP